MLKNILMAAAAIGIVMSAATTAPAMAADVTIASGPGGIAFGYNDGYWDRDHHWQAWKNKEEAAQFREANRDHYYDRKHDADKDMGWRANDRYWERH